VEPEELSLDMELEALFLAQEFLDSLVLDALLSDQKEILDGLREDAPAAAKACDDRRAQRRAERLARESGDPGTE